MFPPEQCMNLDQQKNIVYSFDINQQYRIQLHINCLHIVHTTYMHYSCSKAESNKQYFSNMLSID